MIVPFHSPFFLLGSLQLRRPSLGAINVVLLAFLLAFCQAPNAFPQEPPANHTITATQNRLQEVRPTRYEIEVRFEPERGFLHAQAKVTLTGARCPGAVEFELNPHLKMLEVNDAQGHPLEFDRSRILGSPKLAVRFAEPCSNGPETVLSFTYEGVLPRGPLDYITQDGILLRDESRWYPAVDLAAFTSNDFKIRLPAGWLAIASGDRPAEDPGARSGIQHWMTSSPVSSRSLIAFPSKGVCGGHAGGIADNPMGAAGSSGWVCVAPEYAAGAGKLALGDLLESYSFLLRGPARRDLKLVQGFPGQRGVLGYSAPGFLVVSEDVVKYAGDRNFMPEFLPHEVAHQWFPIEVTLKSEADGWLAESLAEYLAWRYLQEKSPEQARRMVARAMRDSLAPQPLRPLSRGLRLFAEENWDVMHATLYERGLLVWRTLETVIDRERVDRALREYYKRYAGHSASIADFRKICEEISGRNLGWFFDYFLNGTQIPEIELRRLPSPVPNEMAGEIRVKNVPPDFQVRVEMRVETTRGPILHSVATRGEVTPFTVTTPNPVNRVVLDPDARILRWTEAARRNQQQRPLLLEASEKERSGQALRAIQVARKALATDPENLAANEQQIRLFLGRLLYRRGQITAAFKEFERTLYLGSLDPLEDNFHHAWAHVYRARIDKRRRNLAAAREEARIGLEIHSPAMDTQVPWGEPGARMTSASAELQAILKLSPSKPR